MYNVRILNPNRKCEYRFEGYDFVEDCGYKVKVSDYDFVFVGELPTKGLEDIYVMLNIGERPDGYIGHSLSVSDIVWTEDGIFYVDRFGYKKLDEKEFLMG